MHRANLYVDLDGRELCLEHLDAEERLLLARLRRRARTNPDWDAFDNYWTHAVPAFYQGRGLAKPLLTALCHRLRQLGHDRAYLSTAAARLPAIKLYLQFGFVPLIRSEADELLWRGILG